MQTRTLSSYGLLPSVKRLSLAGSFGTLTRFIALAATFLIVCPAAAGNVSLESLLHEMTDRDRLARFPEPEYRSLQASSYNRESVPPPGSPGWFADGDGVQCIRTEAVKGKTEWVLMEHDGPGCITAMWTPYFYYNLDNHTGPKIKIYLDGSDTPVISENFIELVTRGEYAGAPPAANRFSIPAPFAGFTARAGDSYLPIPFGKKCRVATDQKNFYFHINYRAYAPGTAVQTFTMDAYREAASVVSRTARMLLGAPIFLTSRDNEFMFARSEILAPGKKIGWRSYRGAGAVRYLEIKLGPEDNAGRLRSTVLRISFDGEQTVWCPVGDFFCSGSEINPFHTWSRTVRADGAMICKWVMPYQKSAEIELVNLGAKPVTASRKVRGGDWKWDDRSMHFHGNWRMDDPVPGTPFLDWNYIDITGKGVFVGDAWTVLCPDKGWWGEGDEKIYIDDDYDKAGFPSHFGTGTEDYYGWAGGVNPDGRDQFSMPFLSNVRVGNPANPRGYNISTRCRVLDAIPFRSRLRFDMEASAGTQIRNPWNLLHYSAVTFWYARPGARHNRSPQPERATQPPMTVEQLEAMQNAIRTGSRQNAQH